MKKSILLFCALSTLQLSYAQYAPPVGEPGTTAIHKDSSAIVDWANEVVYFERGLEDIAVPDGLFASYGDSTQALGPAEGTSVDVVSLGDLGTIILGFPFSMHNGSGFDFAVFENGFSDDYLEFAHVEVSSDGIHFVRFPSHSLIQTDTQTGPFGNSDTKLVNNLAGKYRQGYGTPFDLEDLIDSIGIDLDDINYVKIIDVVGSINPLYGTLDSEGNLINEPYATDFESGGFDLDGVAIIHSNNPESGIIEQDVLTVSVYPNPTNGIIHFRLNSEIESIQIYDLSGNLVLTQSGKYTIDLKQNGLAKGLYLVKVTDEDGAVYQARVSLVN